MRAVVVIHLFCFECWHPCSARTVDEAREAMLDHHQHAKHEGIGPAFETRLPTKAQPWT